MQQDRPVYIRMGKKGEPRCIKGRPKFRRSARPSPIAEGNDVCLLSTGNMLPEAIEAAALLEKNGHLGAGRSASTP